MVTYEPMEAPFIGPHKIVGREHTSLWGTASPRYVIGQPYVFSATPMPWPSIQGRGPNQLRVQHGLSADEDHQQDTKISGGIILGGMALLAAYVLMK